MANAATVISEHRKLMADVETAWKAHTVRGKPKADEVLLRQGKRMHVRLVRLLRMLEAVDESELREPIATWRLSGRRCHCCRRFWGARGWRW
jgi:hypothetical protein